MKLKRGQKLCKNCQAVNAARQRVCITCNKPFQLKNTPIKHEIKDWQNLQKGIHSALSMAQDRIMY